jgi:hypothetical protein
MGQYYRAVFVGYRGRSVKGFVKTYDFDNGAKLKEHYFIGNKFMRAVEALLIPGAIHHKSRLVWAGDYADEEPGTELNLYMMADKEKHRRIPNALSDDESKAYRYIVNHDKKVYVDKDLIEDSEDNWGIHPLPLLTADGNGRGGGDYHDTDNSLVGLWARDIISLEKEKPGGYELLETDFYDE